MRTSTPAPGCRDPNLRRGSPPACKFGRLPLLRLACFCRRQRLGCAATYLDLNIDHDEAVNELIDGYDAASVPDGIVADRLDSAGYSLGLSIDKASIGALEACGTGSGATALKVTASDGALSAEYTAAFEKVSTSAGLTLTSPIQTDGQILSAVIQVEGNIPTDADYSVQLTNNALDTAPVWQDATEASKTGGRVTFTNQTAANGWAFNFKLEVERGASGTGGYISAVSGSVRSVADDSTGG